MAQEFEGEPAQDPVHRQLKSSWLLTWLACARSIPPVASAGEVMGLLNPQGSARDLAPACSGSSGGCIEILGGNESRTELTGKSGTPLRVRSTNCCTSTRPKQAPLGS